MSRVSQKTFNKVAEDVVYILNDNYPLAFSARYLSDQIARDNEFVSKILVFLKQNGLVEQVDFGKKGRYEKWVKWRVSNDARQKYQKLG